MTSARCLSVVPLAAVLLLAASSLAAADGIDIPVALQGTEQWAGVVAKAMTFGSRDQGESMQAFKTFQSNVMTSLQKKADGLAKLQKGDISDVIQAALTNAVSISAPVFFSSTPSVFSDTIAAIQFGFSGLVYAPCAIPITPLGVGIFPTGVNIQPEAFNIAPTGVNVQPQGASIAPSLIVIGPYDTTVAGQGLNIAPALIAIAPTKEVVNPTGPLAITDTLVSVTVPALP